MSSSSREDSPDWLRSYQAPNQSTVTLSSGSLSLPSDDEDEIMLSKLFKKEVNKEEIVSDLDKEVSLANMILKAKSPAKNQKTLNPDKIESDQDEEVSRANKILKPKSPANKPKADRTPGRKRKRELLNEEEEKRAAEQAAQTKASEKSVASTEPNISVWALSSDSDSCPDSKPLSMDVDLDKKFPVSDKSQCGETKKDEVAILDDEELPHEVSIMKTPKKQKGNKPLGMETVNVLKSGGNSGEMDVEEDIHEKPNGHNISSRLPLVLSEKVQRSKALLECDGDSIDLSGDVGAVGRVVMSDDSSGNHEMLLDLKGTVYRTSIVPSRTFCVVSFGQSEAKVEAIMNDFIQLRPQSNVNDAETMVEGTLEGFSFDSEDDVDDLPKATLSANQNEDGEERPNGKNKQRSQKPSAGKKVKIAGGKPAKKVRKKPQAPRKGKSKK